MREQSVYFRKSSPKINNLITKNQQCEKLEGWYSFPYIPKMAKPEHCNRYHKIMFVFLCSRICQISEAKNKKYRPQKIE